MVFSKSNSLVVKLFLIFFSFSANSTRENLGIVVQYKVKVRLIISGLGGELTAELPFTLTHPKPAEKIEVIRVNDLKYLFCLGINLPLHIS